MASRIVVFGATGYTGRLTAEALVAAGARPLLAARSRARLEELAGELGGLEVQVADIADPASVAALVTSGDVLVSTVGPFGRWGEPAVRAAIDAGAHYLDSTGEAAFIRRVFEEWGPQAAGRCGLLTAFGYDWVPGNLAGALALREAGSGARRVETGYFAVGGGFGMSGGTRASAANVFLEPAHSFRKGSLRVERSGARVRSFELRGRSRQAISVGTSEAFGLPRVAPGLETADTYLGWFAGMSRPLQAVSGGLALITAVPGARGLLKSLSARAVKGSTGGPDAEARAPSRSLVVAEAFDGAGRRLTQVILEGVNGYDFTGRILAWGAITALGGGLRGTGALGPVDGFGLEALEAGCAKAGISVA